MVYGARQQEKVLRRIVELILEDAKQYRRKGKLKLLRHIKQRLGAEELYIPRIRDYISLIRRIIASGGRVDPAWRRIFENLRADAKFIENAKRAINEYDQIDNLYLAFQICERLKRHLSPPGWEGTIDQLYVKIACELKIVADTVRNYVRLMRYVLAVSNKLRRCEPIFKQEGVLENKTTKDHKRISQKLVRDAEYLALAKDANWRWEILKARVVADYLIELMIEHAPGYTRGPPAFRNFLIKKIKERGRKLEDKTIRDYIRTIRAVATGEGKVCGHHVKGEDNLFESIKDDAAFIERAREALDRYDAIQRVGGIDHDEFTIVVRELRDEYLEEQGGAPEPDLNACLEHVVINLRRMYSKNALKRLLRRGSAIPGYGLAHLTRETLLDMGLESRRKRRSR